MAGEQVLEGWLSVQAALESPWRDVHRILIHDKKRYDRRLNRLRQMADAAGIAASLVARAAMDELASGGSHGGVVALVGERRFCHLAQLLPAEGAAFIVMLDGIEDPYNFGGAVRSLYAAGVDGVVLRRRNWTSASAIVGRASAGTIERLPLALVDGAAEAADFYRSRGLTIAGGAKSDEAISLYQADLASPLFLLIGGERRGLARGFLQTADLQLRIPYGRDFAGALGAVGAASVMAFEVMRQRGAGCIKSN